MAAGDFIVLHSRGGAPLRLQPAGLYLHVSSVVATGRSTIGVAARCCGFFSADASAIRPESSAGPAVVPHRKSQERRLSWLMGAPNRMIHPIRTLLRELLVDPVVRFAWNCIPKRLKTKYTAVD